MTNINQKPLTLINPSNGNLAFKIFYFDDNNPFDHLQRLNYYSMILITEGEGVLKADFNTYNFQKNTMLCFTPYQPFMIDNESCIKGVVINFHPDFFCIHKHQKEVACHGVLFNDIYKPPFILLESQKMDVFLGIIEQMKVEIQNLELAQYELLISYLKIFLITASRVKISQTPQAKEDYKNIKEPFILQQLKDAIEQHYKTKHSPNEYAFLLNISTKALAKITKNHFNKTLSHLITERILIEAKRELYLTSKTVKQIAYDLGYDDEHYFSRFFKVNADISPQIYRDSVGFAKAEIM